MCCHNLPPLDPAKGEWDKKAISRRSFLETGFWSITGVASVLVGWTGLRFLFGNSLEPKVSTWVEVGAVDEFVPGEMKKVNYSFRGTDAWREVQQSGTLYAFTENGTAFTVLDATCTHLGCIVRWKEEANGFTCPCHAGHFTREGEVIDGPPPRALRRPPTKIENNILWAEV